MRWPVQAGARPLQISKPVRRRRRGPRGSESAGQTFLEKLDAQLDGHANLFGDRVSFADIAIFPFIRQFANTDRTWFDALPIPALQAWLVTHLESELFQSVMPKFAQWKTGDEEVAFPPASTAPDFAV